MSDGKPLKEKVFEVIEAHGGLTDFEIERALMLPHQTASARRRDLVKELRVIDSGYKRESPMGNWATVWRVVQEEDIGTPAYVELQNSNRRAEILSRLRSLDDELLFEIDEVLNRMGVE